MNVLPGFGGIYERDVDLLLLEEFVSNEAFVAWFLGAAAEGVAGPMTCVEARRSVATSNGESDLEVLFATGQGTVLLVLENKIGAQLQPDQAERYRERVARYEAHGRADRILLVITAPERYFGGAEDMKGFSVRVTYEELSRWFSTQSGLGQRGLHKAAVLQAAIEKATTGWSREVDAGMSTFWSDYYDLVVEHAPELGMGRPDGAPAGSTFVTFRPRGGLPPGIWLIHKFAHGRVDLEVRGAARELPTLARALQGTIDEDMSVVAAGKSAAVRLVVPKLTETAPAAEQAEKLRVALDAARRLAALIPRLTPTLHDLGLMPPR